MKNHYIILLSFLLPFLFITCSENNPVENNFTSYSGTWLWLKTEGGLFPRVTIPEEGMTLKISFDNLNNYKIYRNDSLKVSANYEIEEVENDWDKISYSNITTYNFNFNTDKELSIIHSDTLEIWDGMIDGYFSLYKKIK